MIRPANRSQRKSTRENGASIRMLSGLLGAAALFGVIVTAPCQGQVANKDLPGTLPQAVAVFQVNDLSIPIRRSESRISNQPNERVLLVFDIDNTLLRMPQALGGDAWFNYHTDLVAKRADPDFQNMAALLDAQAFLFGMSKMLPTEAGTSNLIQEATKANVDVFLLSARSPDLYDATKRELLRNGIAYDAPYVCAYFLCSGSGQYGDKQIRGALSTIAFHPQESPYRSILIREGIMMVAGQDKGTMLRLLIAGISSKSYQRVVFVDDSQRNVAAVAAKTYPLPVQAYHYTRWNGSLKEDEVRKTDRQFRLLRSTACKVMAATFC